MRLLALLFACTVGFAAEMTLEPDTGLKTGDKGTLTGTIEKIEKGKVTLAVDGKHYLVMPNWIGGNPKDGGGPDKQILAQVEHFKVGDAVTVAWTFNEHRRIASIAKKD